MSFREIIASVFLLTIGYFLKVAFKEALCEMNSFGCFIGFIAYILPVIIVVAYWMIKLYPIIEPYLTDS